MMVQLAYRGSDYQISTIGRVYFKLELLEAFMDADGVLKLY